MAYQLSATKLQTYHRCPQAYFFRYELGLKSATFFGSTALGTALHQALAQIDRNWHYQDPLPMLDWLHHCWEQNSGSLSPAQIEEGREILENYNNKFIAQEVALHRPLAVEGNIQGLLRVQSLEFKISGQNQKLGDCYPFLLPAPRICNACTARRLVSSLRRQ